MFSSAAIASKYKNYWGARPCAQVLYTLSSNETTLGFLYPECQSFLNGTAPDQYALIKMNDKGRGEQVGAMFGESFAMGIWLALILHMIGVEGYVS